MKPQPSQKDLDRLAKLLGMLGSSHDGEVMAAARKAEAQRKKLGLEWGDILTASTPAPDPFTAGWYNQHRPNYSRPQPPKERRYNPNTIPPKSDHRAAASWIVDQFGGLLTDAEKSFLYTVSKWTGALTERQQKWFDGIYQRAMNTKKSA